MTASYYKKTYWTVWHNTICYELFVYLKDVISLPRNHWIQIDNPGAGLQHTHMSTLYKYTTTHTQSKAKPMAAIAQLLPPSEPALGCLAPL